MPRTSVVAATAELSRRDPVLASLAAQSEPFRVRRQGRDHFGALARSIVYQQLAGKAAAAIHGRFEALFDGPPTPEELLALPEANLRGAGLSGSKTASLRTWPTRWHLEPCVSTTSPASGTKRSSAGSSSCAASAAGRRRCSPCSSSVASTF